MEGEKNTLKKSTGDPLLLVPRSLLMQPARLILEAGGLRYEASNTVQAAASGVFRRFQEVSGCGLSVRSAWSAEMETVRVNQGRATSNVVFMQQLTHSPHPSLC